MDPKLYICRNPSCRWHDKPRAVYPTRLTGEDIYTWPSVFCICSPNIELRWFASLEPAVVDSHGELEIHEPPC